MKSIEELIAIRDKMQSEVVLRKESATATRILVGMGTAGIEAGARDILKAFVEAVTELGLAKDVVVIPRGNIGHEAELAAEVRMAGGEKVVYANLTTEAAKRIVVEHIRDGKPVAEYMLNK